MMGAFSRRVWRFDERVYVDERGRGVAEGAE